MRYLFFLLGLAQAVAITAGVAAEEEKPLYLSIETPPAPELSVSQALEAFDLAPGFVVEIVANEPLVEDPVAIAWSQTGELYVAEMRGFMPDAYGKGQNEPVGAIVRLTDIDGDGKFDKRDVILDQLVLPRAIAIVNAGLLVAEPPHLWLCPPKLESYDCAAKRELGRYGDQPGSVEHAENGLLNGIDNWLYNAKSRRRLKVVGGELVSEPTLFRGQWGITQDNDGHLFYNTNSNLLLGDSYDAQPIVAARMLAAPGLGAKVSKGDQLFAVRVNTGVNRAYVPGVLRKDGRLNRPTSASGMAVYSGDQFGPGHQRDVFVAEPAANAVVQLRLKKNGLETTAEHILYPHKKWQQVEFLASTDERFRPVDIDIGPDGALYIVDMYRGIIQDHVFLTEELRAQAIQRQLDKPIGMGRIWRVRAIDSSANNKTRAVPNTLVGLVAMLGHANGWHRALAQRLLIASADGQTQSLLVQALLNGQPRQSVHAMWSLAGRQELSQELITQAMARGEVRISLAALRSGHQYLSVDQMLDYVQETTDPSLLHHATMYLAQHNAHRQTIHYLAGQVGLRGEVPLHATAIRAASIKQEVALLRRVFAAGVWNKDQEKKSHFVEQLSTQAVRLNSGQAEALLDFVFTLDDHEKWLGDSVLDGLFTVTRDVGFARLVLSAPHEIFGSNSRPPRPALSRARRAVTWAGDTLPANAKPLTRAQSIAMQEGAKIFASHCANCHGVDGRGIASLGPKLAGSTWVTGPSETLARIVLHGLHGPIDVGGENWDAVMPGHGNLPEFGDSVVAGLMTYLHRTWGHSGRALDAEFVRRIRAQQRKQMWTVQALQSVDTNFHYASYVGVFGTPQMQLKFDYDGHLLNVTSAIFNGPMKEQREDHFLFEPRQLALEFIWSDAGKVDGVRMKTDSGGVVLPRINQ